MNCPQHDASQRPDNDCVSGYSVVFSIRHPDKQNGNLKNKLQAHITRRRIKITSLNPRRVFFVENNNVHSLPTHCTGVLVAFSPHVKRISNEYDIVEHHNWFLGTIIFHCYEKTVIAPTEIKLDYFKELNDSKCHKNIEYDIKVDCAVLFNTGEFKLRYLNAVQRLTLSGYPFIHASVHGPDSVPRTSSMKKLIQEHRSSVHCLLPEGISVVPTSHIRKSALLDILNRYKGGIHNVAQRNNTKRRTMAVAGSHVVEIEGPMMSLRDGVDSDCLLVPLVDIEVIKSQKETHLQKYSYIPKDLYTSLASRGPRKISKLNKKLILASRQIVKLTKYDLTRFPNGLLFVYRPNNQLHKPTIVREWDTTEPLEHWQFDGTVLSHWTLSPRTYSVKQSHIKVMEAVYDQRGFNRSSVDSIGINIYTGIKSSPRAIANPV